MCVEKQLAFSEVWAALAGGVNLDGVIELYRLKVAANQSRLGASLS